jgi:hypothetical protein
MPTTKTVNWQGPCYENPAGWDLDAGTLVQWLAALRSCHECPVLARCETLRDEFWPNADPRKPAHNPSGVIMAGVAYSETGRVLDRAGLGRIAALRRNRELAARRQIAVVPPDIQTRAS